MPLEKARVEGCIRAAQQLHTAVQDRLQVEWGRVDGCVGLRTGFGGPQVSLPLVYPLLFLAMISGPSAQYIPLPPSLHRRAGCCRGHHFPFLPLPPPPAQDVLGAAADIIAAQRGASLSSRERLFALRAELEALCAFANGITHRLGKQVYQRLSEVVASFS